MMVAAVGVSSRAFAKTAVVAVFLLLFLVILIRTAWLSDDAAITLRTVLNFLHGFGPTFNIDERVQAYTHPLWFLLLSMGSLLFGNVFYTAIGISITVSLAAVFLLLSRLTDKAQVILLLGFAVVLSKAFVDFSTSGLENPLSHFILLIAVMFASSLLQGEGKYLSPFFLMCSALYLNRPDLLLIVLPLALFVAWLSVNTPKRLIAAIAVSALPVLAWTAFSLVYYGFPFPNTAYAKLGTGIALSERIEQGWKYILHSVHTDPITVFVIVAGVAIGLLRSPLGKCLAIGILLYILYTLSIGGDFMEGRFLTAPFFVSLITLALEIHSSAIAVALVVPVLVLGAPNVVPNLITGSAYNNKQTSPDGIADERGFYFQLFGLISDAGGGYYAPTWQALERKVAVICGGLGFNSIQYGPGMHFIDNCALADPLLARLPAKENRHWRVGHFHRQLPTDYKESLLRGQNLLTDPKTRAYWESIRLVTRGPLMDSKRFLEIARLNLNLIEKPDWDIYRFQEVPSSTTFPSVSAAELSDVVDEGTTWNAPGNIVFDYGIDIILARPTDIRTIDISVDNNDLYEISGLSKGQRVAIATVNPKNTSGMARHKIGLKSPAAGIESIRVIAKSGDFLYSVGHLAINAP